MCLLPLVYYYTHVWPTDLTPYAVAMLHYPDVMRKAQAELDKVIGSDRLPSLDRKSTRLNSSHSGESRMPSSA